MIMLILFLSTSNQKVALSTPCFIVLVTLEKTHLSWCFIWFSNTMKLSKMYSFQRNQLMKFQRKTRVTSSVTLGNNNVQRSVTVLECCSLSCIVKKLFCKLKNCWKQSLGWKRSTLQYSYDLQSYCLNFDDGSSNDRMIPSRVCWWSSCLIFSVFFWMVIKLI